MAETYLVSANIITWKAGAGGKAVYDHSDLKSGVYEAANDEQLKLKLLAEWAQSQDDPKAALGKVVDGLVTVEFAYRSPVTPPTVPHTDENVGEALGRVLGPILEDVRRRPK